MRIGKILPVANNIKEISRQTRRKPAQITFIIPDDLAKSIFDSISGKREPDDLPAVCGLVLRWEEFNKTENNNLNPAG